MVLPSTNARAAHIVIAGAGAAGCVLSARLTENPNLSVLLLEAGPDYTDPAALPQDLVDGGRNSMTQHDWGLVHRPNHRSGHFPFPRGRVVGGSSAVNTCIGLRGQPYDYDEWNDLGLNEWSWDQCLPYFIKLENDLDFATQEHGNEGPLPLRRYKQREWVDWQAAFVEACLSYGFPFCEDSNQTGSTGVGPHAMNKLKGRRISAAEAYLTPEVRARDNLHIQSESLVQRVFFRDARVRGVEVITPQGTQQIATDQVFLCAGAIHTPGILLRSGLGPERLLLSHGVQVIQDLPGVGSRLWDHPGVALFFAPRANSGIQRYDPLIQTVLRYGSGDGSQPNDMLLQPGSKVPFPQVDTPLVSLMSAIGKPSGYGRLELTSKDPKVPPKIHSNLLAHPADRDKAVHVLRLAYDLYRTSDLSKMAVPFLPRPWFLKSKSRLDRWVWLLSGSGYHPSGTVPMGTENDPLAVTDQRGTVRGVKGLRVVDASLMPTIPSSNIHLPTLMMAEKLSDVWKKELAREVG